ncbi:WbqC family protein [Xanthobacter sediminis]|uniref:WbqC family protein n=1 Tax=Xanthobacter sediminis TaxID=3119926 RepID=UPI003729E872
MQPYLYPYAGYFRLMAATDIFVILDCVQFNRRGRVHRAEVPAPAGGKEWLTLPLRHQPRETLIRDLTFADGARAALDERLRRHAFLRSGKGAAAEQVREHLFGPLGTVVDFLEGGLRLVSGLLRLPAPLVRSSSLGLPPQIRGEERIIAIARTVGASRYLNAPGGRGLYEPATFRSAGLELSFLPPYEGRHPFLLPSLMAGDLEDLRADVFEQIGEHRRP